MFVINLPDSAGAESGARVPPQALDAERMVLGAMMLDREAIGRGIEILDEDAFYRRSHKRIYQALISLYDKGEAVDIITVSNELDTRGWIEEVGGLSYLSGLIAEVGTAAHVGYHARIVLEKATLRRLITAAGLIMSDAYEQRLPSSEVLDKAEESIFAIADQRDKKAFTSLREMMKPTFEGIEEQARRKNPITGVETGFADLDTCTSGFQPSDLIIVAGRPSMGKTAFCLNVAENAALKFGRPVAIFSLEMSKEQLIRRLLSSQSRVSGQRLRTGFLRDSDWPALAAAANRLSAAPIYIDDSPSPTVLEMRAKARRLKSEVDLGMIIIDYLQLVRGSGDVENRQQEISQISRSLKALAKELKLPVVALSQLSRAVESRGGDKRPMLSDLRESGAIEQDADVVMFVYRPAMYDKTDENENMAEIIVAKQRNGPTDTINLTFLRDQTRFASMDRRHGGEPFAAPAGLEEPYA
jgi:replicative DNA helicase